jgi:glycosyltransferase involved in cell wall biosynthesis
MSTSTLQVIIPAFNAGPFLAETLDSVLAQDCGNVEVTVLDNASTDDTPRVLERYRDRGVRHVRNPSNIGSNANHNFALRFASADYVKLLSADDVLLPGVLAAQRDLLDAHPSVGLATCDCIVTDEALRPVEETRYLRGVLPGRAAIAVAARKVANVIGAPSNLLVRRSMIGDARYDPTLKWLGDLDFACQLLQRCDFGNIDRAGFLYRRHGASDSVLGCPDSVRLSDEFRFADRYRGGAPARLRIVYRLARRRVVERPLARLRSAWGTAA